MTTETIEQTAETGKTETASTTTSTEKEVTLDDVYRDAGLDKAAAQTVTADRPERQEQQQQTQKVESSSIPDAYDTENFKAYLAREAAGKSELQKAVSAIAGHLTAAERQRVAVATKADIESAVSAIEKTVQLGKPKVIEAYLDGAVREDPRLKALWENRTKNPVAWQAALGVVSKKMAKEFDMKVDPALAAAQRARKDSQKTMATTTESSASPAEERLAAASGSEFDIEWQRLLGHG